MSGWIGRGLVRSRQLCDSSDTLSSGDHTNRSYRGWTALANVCIHTTSADLTGNCVEALASLEPPNRATWCPRVLSLGGYGTTDGTLTTISKEQNVALVKCPDCRRDVSNQAPSCPNCGRPISAQKPPARPAPRKTSCAAWGCLGLIIFVVILGIIGWLVEDSSRSETPRAPVSRLPAGAAQPSVSNSSFAAASDVRQAEQFLTSLPAACSGTSASAASDGTITIELKCSGSSQSLNGLIRIKDGVVTDIR